MNTEELMLLECGDGQTLIARMKKSLFDNVANLVSPEDMHRIEAAFDLANEAHSRQMRKSGIPYISHPISVARIVGEEIGLGANPIIAALLHDVVEDTSLTIDDIKYQFGDDVAFLVDVVTKKKKDEYKMSKQLDNFKQMLDSIQYDIRALLVKLSDRLHNMRTLDSMRTDKQMKIASETDYFYAPLANRLGLYDVKSELENLSLKFRSPQEYNNLERKINKYMILHDNYITEFMESVRSRLKNNNINPYIFSKPRSVYAIWRKMQNKGLSFKEVEHVHIINVILPHDPESGRSEKNICLEAYSLITDVFKERPSSLVNYIDTPKENGYQSLHLQVMSHQGSWVEVHIFTENMYRNARLGCVVERAVGADKWISKFRELLRELAATSKDSGFIEDVVSTFYNDDILVFTPKGNSVLLPKNASVLDMAYEIHTDLGDKAKFARINGRLSSVFTILKRGDRVEIGTDDDIKPNKEWLNHISTYKARKCVNAALRKTGIEKELTNYIMCSNCNPLPGDEIIGFKRHNSKIIVHKRSCKKAITLSAREGDHIVNVNIPINKEIVYPSCISILSVDRDGLLCDLVEVISRTLYLSIESLDTITIDNIVNTTVRMLVPSAKELFAAMEKIEKVRGVEEVRRIEKL